MKRKFLTIVSGSVLAIGIAGCSTSGEEDKDAAAQVGSETIAMEDFNTKYEDTVKSYEKQGMELNEDQKEQVKTATLEQMISQEVVEQEIKKQEIKVTDEDVQKRIDEQPQEVIDNTMEQQDLTMDELKKNLKEQMKYDKFFKANTDEVTVSDEELKSEYDKLVEKAKSTQSKESKESKEGENETSNIPSFDEYKETLKQQLVTQKEREQSTKYVEELKKDYEIEKNVASENDDQKENA
ncbi:SurA N-terminal domain-containing protein [Pontibacillus halophilus]|nr:SurA N-terminal domain-containing protein [Pontibacillus halophilus]